MIIKFLDKVISNSKLNQVISPEDIDDILNDINVEEGLV